MNECRRWTDREISLIMSKRYRDKELKDMLHRTIDAIRTRRYMLQKLTSPTPTKERKYANGVCDETCPDYCPYKDCRLSGEAILKEEHHRKKAKV